MSLDLIIVRILPNPPTDGTTFQRYLTGLTIDAYDQNIIDVDPNNAPTGYQELKLGTASGVVPIDDGELWDVVVQPMDIPPPAADQKKTLPKSIIQHVVFSGQPNLVNLAVGSLKAVATAVIVVDIPRWNPGVTTHEEYPVLRNPPPDGIFGYDLRLEIKRNGVLLDAPDIEWNATYYTVPDLSPYVIDYMGIANNGPVQQPFSNYPSMSQPSLYAIIPDAPTPLPPGTAGVLLKKDGTPPNFDNLLNAVNTVLGVYNLQKGTELQNLASPLTEQQCNDVAYEIAYNRAWFPLPPPVPPFPPPDHNAVLEDLYTAPSKENDQIRSQFEGNLTSFHSKLNAMAMKLSNYIFAASAAIQAERSSATSTMAAMTFPLDPAITKTKAVTTAEVVLTSWDNSDNSLTGPTTTPINPAFTVPAAYFYALGYQLSPNMDSTDRYNSHVNTTSDLLTRTIQWAVNTGVLNASESTVAQSANFMVNTNQALRRLAALSPNVVTSSQPMVYVNNVLSIVNSWLANSNPDSAFWTIAEFDSSEYLNLMIEVVAGGDTTLSGAISQASLVPPAPLSKLQFAKQLPLITTSSWRSLFTENNPPPLPAYTAPGSTKDRINAFIRKLQQIFSVGWEAPTTTSAGSGAVPTLGEDLTENVLDIFLAANSTFSFDSPWNDAQVDVSIFTDENTQRWAKQMLKELWNLVQVTNFTAANPAQTALTPGLRMSYMEALYSRGLVTADRITSISTAQFINATTGTVIETKDASTIHQLALGLLNNGPVTGPEPPFGFEPANPGGLINCIPPANLCPLGHIEYLHQMLQAQSNNVTLSDAVSARRGAVGGLHTTVANLEIDVQEVDLVIESLEALGSGGTSGSKTITPAVGAVYDTSPDLRKVFGVSREDTCVKDDALLAAIPEHSSPAVNIEKAAVYDKLRGCFTSPGLPFSRQLEISRRYLCSLGTDKFETMRRFRSDITEFAIEPSTDPVDFRKQVWRFPVRIAIGVEYIGISQEEYKTLYSSDLPTGVVAKLYGIDPSTESWSNQVLILESFLSATGLSYCELLCLQKSGWVHFEIIPTTNDRESNASVATSNATPTSSVATEDTDGSHADSKTTAKASDEPGSDNPGLLPDCPPCCLSQWRLSFGDVGLESVLARIILFVRLWRTINSGCRDKISFSRLADICTVLELFDPTGHVNPGFIQQLPSLTMLHDFFYLPWSDYSKKDKSGGQSPPVPGSSGTEILALWSKSHSTIEQWDWAVGALLRAVHRRAETEFHCARRQPGFLKIIAQNLDPLSKLAGFSDSNPWYQSPTCTIRFAEVLTKIYGSKFTVGEILFLFTVEHHLDGDDPFPLASRLETFDHPLKLPDDQLCNSLDALREKLLCVEISNEECEEVGWHRLESIIRDAGYMPSKKVDHLQGLAEHFFPETLGGVSSEKRRYSTPLSPNLTSPKVWSADPCIPFHYEVSASSSKDSGEQTGDLWTTIPLRDESVFRKLQVVRQLRLAEVAAVRNLYYMPRAALAPFALLFDNFGHAVEKLVQEPCEKERFTFFTRQVLLFHRRCKIISRHLAAHVKDATSDDGECGSCGPCRRHERHDKCENFCSEDETLAWTILKTLIADENTASRPGTTGEPWEIDDGSSPPNFEWNAQFSGNAVSAILGLIGTGLKGTMASNSGAQWVEMRGGLETFGNEKNKWNEPVPIVIPHLSILPNSAQNDLVSFKNGLAFRNKDDNLLYGAEPFSLEWKGTLIVDCAGCYIFSGGRPHGQKEKRHCDMCDDVTWLVTLQRGQKKFNLLSHGNEHIPGPSFVSREVKLEKGTYAITVEFAQKNLKFDHPLDVDRESTGFQVRWEGQGTGEQCFVVPFCDLIIDTKKGAVVVSDEVGGTAAQFRRFQYYSSLRDIRRTYQRAFKALLFAKNFCLDAKGLHCDGMSEMQYLLNNAQRFEGTSFYPVPGDESLQTASTGSWAPHHAWLDFNFLPVGDPFFPPDPGTDSRANPSSKRQAALFDWWERMFDYTRLRDRSKSVTKKSLWLLFQEAGSEQPYLDMAYLVRYLKIDPDIMDTLLNYSVAGNTVYTITGTDLLDERWTTRLWLARQYAKHLVEVFFTDILEKAKPALWAADDLEVDITVGQDRPESGLKNLVSFVQSSTLNSDECASRLSALRELNDDLRKRSRYALVVYLTQLNRVELPDGAPITMPRQLSDLLLQDVQADLGEATTRILDACSSVQKFVQRARIGLEPQFPVTEDFSHLWECRFATFETWVAWARRQLYGENWTQWEELKALKKGSEAGWLLDQELPAEVETLTEPGRSLGFQASQGEPKKKGVELIQTQEMVVLDQHTGSTLEYLSHLGTPDHHARPTLLRALIPVVSSGENPNSKSKAAAKATAMATVPAVNSAGEQLSEIAIQSLGSVPIWIESAIRLGTRFIRVAASARPPAFPYKPKDEKKCCEDCGRMHLPCIDEYYFWLHDDSAYDDNDVPQEADLETVGDDFATAGPWNDPKKLAGLLAWKREPNVVLFWTRVHAGQLLPLRRSAEGVRVDLLPAGGASMKLELEGRNFDSLFLTVNGRNLDPTKASGTNPGFRYDIATDLAIVTPQVVPDEFPASVGTGLDDFAGYPWFAYFKPGIPLAPPTPFGVALALGTKLKDSCRYEAALNWLRAAFDPLGRDNTWAMCIGSLETSGNNSDANKPEAPKAKTFVEPDPRPRFRDSPCCPGVTQQPSTRRSRAVFLEYLDTLLLWADQLADAGPLEKAQQALVLLETMDHLLGDRPKSVESHPSPIFNTMTVENFIPSAPSLNPRLLNLYDEVDNRMSRMRRRVKGKGTNGCSTCNPTRDLGLDTWELSNPDGDTCCDSLCQSTPCQPYRFISIFPKATELASLVKQLASSFVSAYERGDAEYLAALRQSHESTMLDLGIDVAQFQWRAADWDVQALGEQMQSALARLRYNRFLLDRGNVTGEAAYQTGEQTSMNSNSGGNMNDSMAETFNMNPDFAFGIAGNGAYQSTQVPIGQKMAGMASSTAKILNTTATIASTGAGLSLTQAGWQRRNEDWQHQIDLCVIEIAQIKRQILASQRRKDVALRELNNHQRQLEHAGEVMDFMRDKYSRHSLFLFLQHETNVILKGTFDLALRTARDAYQAFLFERMPMTPGSARAFPSVAELWSGPFEGANAGDRLDLALRRLEREYMNNNCRELELNKRISLRESFPKNFIELRLWGRCEVDIKEWRFDEDHPGLWMRRLRSVTFSVPCVAGSYTGVHARVRLLGSATRTRPVVRPEAEKCCKSKHKGKRHCCWDGECDKDAEDPYLVHRFASSHSSAALTATSHGQDDGGLFENSMHDERYLPFEYEGAVSKWRVEMPEAHNLFDFQSLADVVVNLNYTAREGSDELRKKATRELSFGGPRDGWWRGFEIRREFPDAWPLFEANGIDWEEGRKARAHSVKDGEHGCGCESHRQHGYPDSRHGQRHHHDHEPSKHRHGDGFRCASGCMPPRAPSPHHHDGSVHFNFPLRLRRGMFPFLAPGPPAIRITTLCIYVVLPRARVCHKACPDKDKDQDDTCACGDKPGEKKCCCPAAGRHFPVLFIPPGEEEKDDCRENWRSVELVPYVSPPGVIAADDNGELCRKAPDHEVYQCEIGDLNLGPIGHDDRNRPMRGVIGGEEVYGHLRFPKSIGRVKEAWVLCGFEPVVDGAGKDCGGWKVGWMKDDGKKRDGDADCGERRRMRKYFWDMESD